MIRQSTRLTAICVVSLLGICVPASAQNTYTWNGAANGAWLSITNWRLGTTTTGSSVYPGVSSAASFGNANDVAVFGGATGSTTYSAVGINLSSTGANGLSLGAVHVEGSGTVVIQNSSTTANLGTRFLTLNGVSPSMAPGNNPYNLSEKTILSVINGNLTIQPGSTASGTFGLGVRLGITDGIINVAANRLLLITSTITQANYGSGFTLTGSGQTLLTNVNTFTGMVVVQGGSLGFAWSGAIGGIDRRNIVAQTGAAVAAAYAIDQAFLNRMALGSSGTVALAVNSSNNLSFEGFNSGMSLGAVGIVTYTGTLTPNLNVYRLGGGGGTLTYTSALVDGVTAGRSLVVGGSGSGGTVILTNTNTYLDGTTITMGTLQIGNGGTTGSIVGNVISNANLAFNRSDDITFGGIISGTGTLTKLGAGKLKLTKANTVASTTIGQGILELDFTAVGAPISDILAGTSLVTLSGGSLNLLGAEGATNTQSFTSTTFSAGAGNISATAGSGGTVALNLGAISRSGTGTGNVNLSSGFTVSGTGTVTNGILGGYLTVNSSDWATLDGSNLVALTTGYTAVGSGTLPDDATLNVRTTGTVTLNSSTTTPTFTTLNTLKLDATRLTGNQGGNAANSFLRLVNGLLVPTGVTASIGDTSYTITAGSADNTAGALLVYAGGNVSIGSNINNNGTGIVSLVKTGPGTLTLGVTNSHTGPVTINEGTLLAATTGAIGSNGAGAGSSLVMQGGTFQLGFAITSGLTSTFRQIRAEGAATLDTQANYFRYNNTLAGAGTLTKIGTGTFALGGTAGASPFTGNLIIQQGLLTQAGSGSSLGLPLGLVTLQGGNLEVGVAGGFSIDRLTGNGTVTASVAGALIIGAASGTSTFSGVLNNGTATLSLIKNGTGTFTLDGTSPNGYTGTTVINNGVLRFNALNLVGGVEATRTITIANPGVLAAIFAVDQSLIDRLALTSSGTLALGADSASDLNLTGITGTLTLGAFGSATYSGSLTPNGTIYRLGGGGGTLTFTTELTTARSLIVNGSGSLGTVILTFDNSYTGGTTIASGTLQLGNGGTGGSITGNVVNNGHLVFNRSDVTSFSGVISGTGVLQKTGSGQLTLTGANTHLGGTVVSQGSLVLSNANALPTTSEIVLQGGTLRTLAGIPAYNAGPLRVSGPATINLVDAVHTLTFAGFDPTSPGQLSIMGWEGVEGGSGTKGQLLFNNIGTQPNTDYAGLLSTVHFVNYPIGATFLGSGPTFELVPLAAIPEPGHILGITSVILAMGLCLRNRLRRASDGTRSVSAT